MWFTSALQTKLSAAIILLDVVLYHPVCGGNVWTSLQRIEQEYNELLMIRTGWEDDLPTDISDEGWELVESTRRNKQISLKCTYLLSGLYHLRLTGLLLKNLQDTDMAVLKITSYATTVRKQMNTLLKFGVGEMKTMWMLYLYINLLSEYPKSERMESEFKERAIKAQTSVLNQIETEVRSCRINEKINGKLLIQESECGNLMQKSPVESYNKIMKHVNANIWNTNHIIEMNHVLGTLTYTSDQSISLSCLYLNDFGSSQDIHYLITAYNAQVVWNDIPHRLDQALKMARSLDVFADELRPLFEYQTMCMDFVIIIMLRLTLKHIEYLRQMVVKADLDTTTAGLDTTTADVLKETKPSYVKQWLDILVDFAMLLDLNEDHLFKYLLLNFDINTTNLYDQVQSEMVINNINLELNRLSNSLGVFATIPIVLDGKEFHTTYYTQYNNFILKRYINPKTIPELQLKSIYCSQTFVQLLQTLFENVDFKVVRTVSKPSLNRTTV